MLFELHHYAPPQRSLCGPHGPVATALSFLDELFQLGGASALFGAEPQTMKARLEELVDKGLRTVKSLSKLGYDEELQVMAFCCVTPICGFHRHSGAFTLHPAFLLGRI